MIQVDIKDIKKLEKNLGRATRFALPIATQRSLNDYAFYAMNKSKENVAKKMIVRTPYTTKSIQVNKAKGLKMNRMKSSVGSTVDYLADQEFGYTKTSKSKEGLSIPTTTASGEPEQARTRRKLVRRRNKLTNLKLRKVSRKAKSSKQELLLKVQDSVAGGNRVFFHDFGGRKKKGIFRVYGGRKTFKRGWPKGAKIKMLFDMSKKVISNDGNKWLMPSVNQTEKISKEIYYKRLDEQMKRFLFN
jgi:hypothetical protein